MIREGIFIAHIVTDENGNLKIKKFEEFTDSKALVEFYEAVKEAQGNKVA